jgi:hypothetical protein
MSEYVQILLTLLSDKFANDLINSVSKMLQETLRSV